jgi:uncharacterized protein involved in outer membrane biogenesis
MASKRFKRITIIALVGIATLILAAYVILVSLDFNRFKPLIVQAVREATGLDVVLHGNMKVKLGFNLNVVINDVEIRNDAWAPQIKTATIKRCEFRLALLPLIRGFVEIDRLVFIEPNVLLETEASGEMNVRVKNINRQKKSSGEIEGTASILPVREVQVKRGRLAYKDGLSGKTYTVDVERLILAASDMKSPVQMEFHGLLNGRPVEAEGTFGSPAAFMDSNDPWPVNLTAKGEDASARVQGTIKEVTKLRGMSLKAHAAGPSISRALSFAGIRVPPDLGPFSLDATICDREGKLSLSHMSLLLGTDKLALIRISGTVDNLLARRGIHLGFTAQCEDLSRLSKLSRKPLPLRGPLTMSGKILDSEPGIFSVSDLRIALGDKSIIGSVRLDLAGTYPRSTIELVCQELDLRNVLPPGLGESTWVYVLKRMGFIDLTLSVADPYGRPVVEELDLRAGNSEEAALTVKGAIENPLTMTGIEARFNIQGKDAADLEKLFGKPVPLRGPFIVSGHLEDLAQNVLASDDLQVSLGKNEVAGLMDLNMAGEKPQLDATLCSQRLDLEPVLQPGLVGSNFLRVLRSLGPVGLAISISDLLGKPVVEELNARIGTDNLAAVELNGSVQDLLAQKGIRLDLTVRGRDAAHLGKILGRPVPVKGPFALSGEILDTEAGEYSVKDFKATLGGNELLGRMALSLGQAPLMIRAEFSSQDLDLHMVDGMEKAYAKMRHTLGPWTLAFTLLNERGKLVVPNADLRFRTQNLAETEISGTIQDLLAWQGVDLKFSIRGSDLEALEKLTGKPVPAAGGFALTGRLVDPQARIYRVREFHALLGDNDFDGSFELDLTGKRAHLFADLSSKILDLRPLLARSKPNPKKDAKRGKTGKKGAKVLPAEPLRLGYLHFMDGAIKLRAEQILLPRLTLESVTADISLEDGHLEMNPFQCFVGGGTVKGSFDLRPQIGKIKTALDLNASRVDLGAVSVELGVRKFLEGTMWAKIKVEGQGSSIAELAGGLNGSVLLAERDGRIYTSEIDFIGSSLFSKIIQLIDPFSQKEKYSELYCNVQNFVIKDGVAACKPWLADTKYTTVRGGGEIDLRNETLNLLFALSPTKSSIGIKGVAGLHLPSFINSFKVEGTFSDPSISVNPSGAAEVIGKMVGGFALLGPLGLAAGLIDLNRGKENFCRTVMEAVEKGHDIPEDAEKQTPFGAQRPISPPMNNNGGYGF